MEENRRDTYLGDKVEGIREKQRQRWDWLKYDCRGPPRWIIVLVILIQVKNNLSYLFYDPFSNLGYAIQLSNFFFCKKKILTRHFFNIFFI